ncbi:MAG: hypothetical protein RL762_300 [Bacteroidota bacterium]|jgi:hypothetical protein
MLLAANSFGQRLLSGIVTNESNLPLAGAEIFVKSATDMRTVADAHGYYEMYLNVGEYYLVFTADGYQDREAFLGMRDADTKRDIQLFPMKLSEVQEVRVTAKKSNVGRDKIMKVVEHREQLNQWSYPHEVDVYIKATEQRETIAKPKNENTRTDPDPTEFLTKVPEWLNKLQLAEVELHRSYAPPNQVKEIRNAYKAFGDVSQLYYTTTVKSNFNFFENSLHLDDLNQIPIASPISAPGIVAYKYKLEEKYEENGYMISKIKISPRNTATSTLEGYIWVIDSLWLVQKLDFTMYKGNLLIYDYFRIEQDYQIQGDTLCVLQKQLLTYGVEYKNEVSQCKTEALYSNYNFEPAFAKRYFNSEVAVTSQEAYERDSAYWVQKRAIALTDEEIKFIRAKDSITDYLNRKEYLDSIDAVFNKVTALKVLWFGVDHRNRELKQQWTISSLASTVQPINIGGPRVAPSFDYFKKWKDERTLDSYTRISYGFLNGDWKGDTWWKYRFDPFHFGFLRVALTHDFDVIRGFDALTQVYKRDNFFESTKLNINLEYELFNGFYAYVNSQFTKRRSLEGYEFLDGIDQALPNNDPLAFAPYDAYIINFGASYTPKQRYMREPYRKVVLGSAYPTFSVNYERGLPQIFNSAVDHAYLQVEMMQNFKIGTLGTSAYRVSVGKFLSARAVYEPDYKFQRRSDPIWFSNPLYSFQGFDTLLRTIDFVMQAHYVHHDNGAILNKIPYFKKTRVGLVVGAGAMYIKEYNWQHYEVVAGLERNFKLSRRRLRIGLYGVISDGNKIAPTTAWKVSFAMLDDRSMKWNF